MTGARSHGSPMLVIEGQATLGDLGAYPVHDPGRPGEVVLDAPHSSRAQVDLAVRTAAEAVGAWAATPLDERRKLVLAAAAATDVGTDEELAILLTRENGKILTESQFEHATVSAVVETFAQLAPPALAERRVAGGGAVSFEPFGVVAVLLPFNWPVSVLVSKIAPALIAGNTVVVKPPPTCPGAVLTVARAMAASLPPGVLNTVNGPSAEVGEALVGHPLVAMVSLTGGTRTGRAVGRMAAERLIPTLLELGGNDAGIVAPDVEPNDALAAELLSAALLTSGQVCMALKRLYVPADRLGSFTDALVTQASTTVTGYGLDEETSIGPVHTAASAQRAEAILAEASAAGARVHRPGSMQGNVADTGGHFVTPAIVEAPPPEARVVVEEQFAPLLPVIGYHELTDAVAAANASSFGLGASVWSNDDAVLDDIARRLEAGTVFRNAHGPGGLDPQLPFGGWKSSGIGREYGPDGLLAYTRSRALPAGRQLPGSIG